MDLNQAFIALSREQVRADTAAGKLLEAVRTMKLHNP